MSKQVTLINPWTQEATAWALTWGEIERWAKEHVHQRDLSEWLKTAKRAYAAGDGAALGRMIIGA